MAMDILYLFIAFSVSVPCFGKHVSLYNNIIVILVSSLNPVAQYAWNCTTPNCQGQKFIPDIRDLSDIADNATLNGDILNIYSVPSLNHNCDGQVTGIEYCYCYRTNGQETTIRFNWTLLVLSEAGQGSGGLPTFTIIDYYNIESHMHSGPGESGENCVCNWTDILDFDLPEEKFAFAVTESAIGNSHEAALQRSHDTVASLRVYTTEQTPPVSLSRGSSFMASTTARLLGLPYLWFVVGNNYFWYT